MTKRKYNRITPADEGISGAREENARRLRGNGLGQLWIVTRARRTSTLEDILFHVDPQGFALQIRGGLDPDEIIGWFDSHSEANQIALQELYRAGATS